MVTDQRARSPTVTGIVGLENSVISGHQHGCLYTFLMLATCGDWKLICSTGVQLGLGLRIGFGVTEPTDILYLWSGKLPCGITQAVIYRQHVLEPQGPWSTLDKFTGSSQPRWTQILTPNLLTSVYTKVSSFVFFISHVGSVGLDMGKIVQSRWEKGN